MEQNEKIRLIAEYDGWVKRDYQPVHGRELYDNDNSSQWLDSMPYRSDLNLLHPLAMKVLDEFNVIILSESSRVSSNSIWAMGYKHVITDYCSVKPVNNEYIDLFNAVCDGISFINTINSDPRPAQK